MKIEFTSRERFLRIYNHTEADRIPVIDSPWPATIERWRREGMPHDVDPIDYFDLDRHAIFFCDNSPRYPQNVIEETEDYRITTTSWGATMRNWKHATTTPEFLNFTVVDRDSWIRAKALMKPDRDRIDWDCLRRHYKTWRQQGYWLEAGMRFGFDTTHAWMVGTERILIALAEDPEWCMDMFSHQLELNLTLLEMMWEEGYPFDSIFWADDMGYKHHQFFSLNTYRQLCKPFHKKVIEWAHAKGVKARLHSCGDINPFIPDLIEIGLDALNPLEVKAGMDPVALKHKYGHTLTLHGGINAVLWEDLERMNAEMERVIPALKTSGGYIFSSDHSVPSSVSLDRFRETVRLAKLLGSYS